MGMRKIVKQNQAELVAFKSLIDLTGSAYFFGRIGGGKTTSMTSVAQKYHDDKGYKIFDLYGGERNEHLYWCFPSSETRYWHGVKKLMNLDKEGPKQYQVHLLYPYYKSMTPNKLPFDAPNVRSTIFTIPFASLEIEDVYLGIGLTSDTDNYVFRDTHENIYKKDGPRKIQKYAKDISIKNQSIFRSFIQPLTSNLLLQSEIASTNLDVYNELKDRETVTVLCLEFVPKEYRLFIIGWFVRQLAKELDKIGIYRKNILLMRESAEFFRATDDSIMPEPYKIFRKQLSNFLRYGRRGLHFFLDAQSPRETKGLVDGQQDLTILCKLPAESDREDATAQLKRDNLITSRQIAQLAILEPGQLMFIVSGDKARLRYVLLPRTRFWKPGDGNFYTNLWDKFNGNYKNYEALTDELKSSYDLEDTQIKELEALAELKAKESKKKKIRKKNEDDEEEIVERIIESKPKITPVIVETIPTQAPSITQDDDFNYVMENYNG